MNDARGFLTISGQSADADGGMAVLPYRDLFNRILRSSLSEGYGGKIAHVGIVLRVDGKAHTWGPEGPQNLSFTDHSMLIDVVIPTGAWQADHEDFRIYLLEMFKKCIGVVLQHIESSDSEFDKSSFQRDSQVALDKFLEESRVQPVLSKASPLGRLKGSP